MPPLNSGLNGEKTANISGEKLEAHLLNLPNSMFSLSMLKEKNCANFSSALCKHTFPTNQGHTIWYKSQL